MLAYRTYAFLLASILAACSSHGYDGPNTATGQIIIDYGPPYAANITGTDSAFWGGVSLQLSLDPPASQGPVYSIGIDWSGAINTTATTFDLSDPAVLTELTVGSGSGATHVVSGIYVAPEGETFGSASGTLVRGGGVADGQYLTGKFDYEMTWQEAGSVATHTVFASIDFEVMVEPLPGASGAAGAAP
jgi:hypothetical protein